MERICVFRDECMWKRLAETKTWHIPNERSVSSLNVIRNAWREIFRTVPIHHWLFLRPQCSAIVVEDFLNVEACTQTWILAKYCVDTGKCTMNRRKVQFCGDHPQQRATVDTCYVCCRLVFPTKGGEVSFEKIHNGKGLVIIHCGHRDVSQKCIRLHRNCLNSCENITSKFNTNSM